MRPRRGALINCNKRDKEYGERPYSPAPTTLASLAYQWKIAVCLWLITECSRVNKLLFYKDHRANIFPAVPVTWAAWLSRHVSRATWQRLSVIVTSNTEMAAMVITGDHLVSCHEHTAGAPLSLTSQWARDGHRSDKRNGNTLSIVACHVVH